MHNTLASNWHKDLLTTHPDVASALTAEDLIDEIGFAVIVEDGGKQHLEVYPSSQLKPEEANRFNERLCHAVGDKINLAVILPNALASDDGV